MKVIFFSMLGEIRTNSSIHVEHGFVESYSKFEEILLS